jgi:adenine-specific DNA methylase
MFFCLSYIRSALQQLVKKDEDLVAKFECFKIFYNKNLEKLKLVIENWIYREILKVDRVGFEPTTTYVSSINDDVIYMQGRYSTRLNYRPYKHNIFLLDNLSAFNYSKQVVCYCCMSYINLRLSEGTDYITR